MRLGSEGQVLWHVTMTPDGVIAGPDDAMEWAFEYPEPSPVAEDTMDSPGRKS